jgi:lipopolysaccharide biosynthesis protein
MPTPKIAVLIHLFYTDMWDEMCGYLNNLDYDYDLYVNLVDGFYEPEIFDKINKYKVSKIITSPNKGVDVGGFLRLYKILDSDYDLILKLHTKKSLGLSDKPSDYVRVYGFDSAKIKGTEWFHRLMNGVLGSKEQVRDIVDIMNEDMFVMSGLDTEKYVGPNIQHLNDLANKLSLIVEYENVNAKNFRFVGGTIFWVKNYILKKYLTDKMIDELLEILPNGYQNEPSYNHALERLFGLMVYNEKKKIINL